MKIITAYFFIFSFYFFRGQSNVVNNTSNDTIVVIITSKNKEIRGLLIREDYNSLSLEVANEIQTYQKNNIKSYRFITRDLIKSIKKFDNPNPIYTKYCYLPSAFITFSIS